MSVAFSLSHSSTVWACNDGPVGSHFGNPGWFTGTRITVQSNGCGGDNVLPGSPAVSLPDDNVENFINFVVSRLSSGDQQTRTGAQFIVATMTGTHSRVGAGDPLVADWEGRVRYVASLPGGYNHDTIISDAGVNSLYMSYASGGDDAYYSEDAQSQEALVFSWHDSGGSIKTYSIRLACANPIGDPVALPEPPTPATGDYDLTPTVSVTPAKVQPGATVTFNYNIANGGSVKSPDITTWEVDQNKNGGGFSSQGSGQYAYPPGNTASTGTFTIPSTDPPGTTYCRTLSTNPSKGYTEKYTYTTNYTPIYDNSTPPKIVGWNSNTVITDDGVDPASTDPFYQSPTRGSFPSPTSYDTYVPNHEVGLRTSPQACIEVVAWPMAYFDGADVWAGGTYPSGGSGCANVNAQIYTSSNSVPGVYDNSSNEQFAAFATGSIRGFGSAGTYWQGTGGHGEDGLMFANTGLPSGNLGTVNHCLTDFYKDAPTATLGGGSFSVPGPGTYSYSGDITLTGGTVSGDVKIYTTGKVTITGDITYDQSGQASISTLPRLIVSAAGNITVNNSVSNITGTYQTRGTFSTCEFTPTSGVAPQCPNQLHVKGSIIASSVNLRRTGGQVGDPSKANQAAEYLTDTPDTILSNYGRSQGSSQIQTVQETELPPRY